MKTISFDYFQRNFDLCLNEVSNNIERFKITLPDGKAVVLMNYEEYKALKSKIKK